MSSSTSLFETIASDGSSALLFDMSGRFYFPQTNVTAVMDGLPPAPITWIYNAVDTIVSLLCYYVPRYCLDWRRSLGFDDNSSSVLAFWLSPENKIPPIASFKPHLLTFAEYQSQSGALASDTTIFSYLHSWYQYAFRTSSTALGDLTTPAALLALCGLVLLLRLGKARLLPLFGRVGRRMALHTHGAAWVADNEIRIVKFGEYVFRLLYHSIISVYGVAAFRQQVWWSDGTIHVFRDYPHHEIAPEMAWYYLLQSAYNVDALLTLLQMSLVVRWQSVRRPSSVQKNGGSKGGGRKSVVPLRLPVTWEWSEQVRGDFQEMFVHHVVTNALVIGSSMLRLTRIGSMVFLIHDVSDVPVDLSKLANFLKWKITTVVCFGTMALTWLYTRLYLLPVKIYWTTLTQSHYVLESGTVHVLQYICYRHFFYIFLGLLILLHAAWFLMFLRMFHTLIVKRECHDYSEHKNGEPPAANGKKTA